MPKLIITPIVIPAPTVVAIGPAPTAPAASSASGATSATPPAAPLPAAGTTMPSQAHTPLTATVPPPAPTPPIASPVVPPAAAAPSPAPAPVAAPATISISDAVLDTLDPLVYLNTININSSSSVPDLFVRTFTIYTKITSSGERINTICRLNSLGFEINLADDIPTDKDEFDTYFDSIKKNVRDFKIKLRNITVTNRDLATMLGEYADKILNISIPAKLNFDAKFTSLTGPTNPPGGGGGTGGGAGASRTPGAPVVDTTALERQMNSEWDALKNHIKDPQQEYTTKKQKLEEYIGKLIAGTYGAVTGVPDDNPAKLKLVEARALFQSCVSVEQEFRTVNILSSQNAIQDSIARLIRLATDAQTIDALENIIRSANDLKRNFSTTVGQTRRIKIEYTEPNARNAQVKKTKTVDLAKDPLVFDMMYGNTTYIINRDLTDDFFDAQTSRISRLDKSKTAFDKLEADIKVLTAVTIVAIESTKTEIMAAIPRAGGIISKGDWNRFLGVYADKVEVLRNVIKNKNAELDAKVPSPDVDNKVRNIVNVEKAKIAIEAAKFKQDFDVLPYPKSKSPRGNNANQAFNSYLWVDGVTKDKTVGPNKDKPTGKVTDMAILSGVSFITTPNFDDLSPTSPASRGSASPYGAMGAINARIDGIPREFGELSPVARRLVLGGGGALVAVLGALLIFVANNKKGGDGNEPDAKGKTAATAAANADNTTAAVLAEMIKSREALEKVATDAQARAVAPRNSNAPNARSTGSVSGDKLDKVSAGEILNKAVQSTDNHYGNVGVASLSAAAMDDMVKKMIDAGPNTPGFKELENTNLGMAALKLRRPHQIEYTVGGAKQSLTVTNMRLIRMLLGKGMDYNPETVTVAHSHAGIFDWLNNKDGGDFILHRFSEAGSDKMEIYFRKDMKANEGKIGDALKEQMANGSQRPELSPEQAKLFTGPLSGSLYGFFSEAVNSKGDANSMSAVAKKLEGKINYFTPKK